MLLKSESFVSTQATEEAYRELVPQFEKATGHKVLTIFTGTLDVQKRLAASGKYNMVTVAGPAIDAQIKAGKAVAGSRIGVSPNRASQSASRRAHLSLSPISAPPRRSRRPCWRPSRSDIRGAKRRIRMNLFERLGVADQVKGQLDTNPSEPGCLSAP